MFKAAGAGAGVNSLKPNKPETFNPGREKTGVKGISGSGWRYCAPTRMNSGMPGRVNGRPPGGELRYHPAVDAEEPFPEGEGTSAGPVQDPERTGPTKRRPALREGASRPKVASALRRAAGDGDSEAVEGLLDGVAADCLEEPNEWTGQTALIEAARGPAGSAKHLVTLRLLIDRGAAVDAQDSRGGTAMLAAAQRGYTMAVHALLAAGADPNLADEEGTTPLGAAAAAGKREVVETLIAGEAPPPRIRLPDGPFATAEIDALDLRGRSAVLLAAQHARLNCLRLLAEKGAALEAKDRLEGYTALHHACRQGWAEMAEVLLTNGAEPAAVDEQGRNPMALATAHQQLSVVQRLRELASSDAHPRLRAEARQFSSASRPKGQIHDFVEFTNDPTWLDPAKYQAGFTAESTEFVGAASEARGGYADPDFRFPGPSGRAAQWLSR